MRATDINEEMKVAAVHAIAEIISESDLHEDYVIPDPFNKQVAEAVAQAVSEAAIKSGVSQGEHLDQD